jgi:type VI secretion system FHA domain protein
MVNVRVILRSTGATDPLRQQNFVLQSGGAITFGRSAQNDIAISDPEKRVSTRHGRLELRPDGGLYAVDAGSMNHTYYLGTAVDSKAGVLLSDGDVLRICDFELQIFVTKDSGIGDTDGIDRELDATMSLFDPVARGEVATRRLEALYAAELHNDQTRRLEALQNEARRAVADLAPVQAATVLHNLEQRFASLADDQPPAKGAAAQRGSENPGAANLGQASVDALRSLAARFVPGASLRSPADVKLFATLLQQVAETAVGWLARNLQSRSVFAQEFGAEVTAMFQRTENPLKGLPPEEVGKYLLDWNQTATASLRQHYLEGVMQDLAEHQLGLLAGVREAVENVVAQVSPERVLAAAKDERSWSLASRSARAWETYERMYAELFEERGKLFNEVISPGIQQGYLQQHQRADAPDGGSPSQDKEKA